VARPFRIPLLSITGDTIVRLLALGLAAAILSGGLSGCTSDDPHTANVNGVKFMDESARNKEYQELADSYPWPLPEGLHFPRTLKAAKEPTVYELGEGANQADTFWTCAWMTEWLRTRETDPRSAKTAWAWVERADQTELHTKRYYDPHDVWHKEILEPAERGQVKSFREFQATSCAYPELTQRLKPNRSPASQ
jgi:hypothetical protein